MIIIILIIASIMIALSNLNTKRDTQKEERTPHVKKLREIEIKFYEIELIRQLQDLRLSAEEVRAFSEYLDKLEVK